MTSEPTDRPIGGASGVMNVRLWQRKAARASIIGRYKLYLASKGQTDCDRGPLGRQLMCANVLTDAEPNGGEYLRPRCGPDLRQLLEPKRSTSRERVCQR